MYKNLTTPSDHDGRLPGCHDVLHKGQAMGGPLGGVVAWQATEQSWDDPWYGPAVMRLAIDARGRCRGTSWGQTRRRGGRERGQRQAQGGT